MKRSILNVLGLLAIFLIFAILFIMGSNCVGVEDCTVCGEDSTGQCCDKYSRCVSIDGVYECERK